MNSRNKGKAGEREFAALLREQGFDARRGQQFSGGAESPDVVSPALAWLHFEIKRVQKLNLMDACAQAEGDSNGKPWVVAHRRNHAPWLITMRAEFFFELLREFQPRSASRTGNSTDAHGLGTAETRRYGEEKADTNFTNSHGGETPTSKRTEGNEGSEEELRRLDRVSPHRKRGQASPFPPNDGGKDAVLTPRAHGGPEDYLGCGDGRSQ